MISLYSGTPGSGKSLHVAQRIYYGLRARRRIVANFEINLDYVKKKRDKRKLRFHYIPNDELNPETLINISIDHFKKRGHVKEDDILLVIDECQLIFNAREWNKSGRSEWLSFFSQHRKYGYEVVLVAQFDGMVDKQIRTLIEYEIKHRKVGNFGIVGKCLSIISFGNLFCAVRIWYPLSERVSSEFFKANKKYYRIYDTFTFFVSPDTKIRGQHNNKLLTS